MSTMCYLGILIWTQTTCFRDLSTIIFLLTKHWENKVKNLPSRAFASNAGCVGMKEKVGIINTAVVNGSNDRMSPPHTAIMAFLLLQ